MACGWARRSWIDAGEFLGVQAVGGSLTHVERRLGLRHRPLSSSLRCQDCGGRGDGARRCSKKLDWPVATAGPRTASFSLGKGHVARVASLRSRAVGPFDDELTDDGDVCPQVSGPVHADPLSRVRDDPRRATRSTRPPDGTLFTLSPQCRPLALTSSSFGAPNRMASSLGLRAAAPARARVATQSSRSMVVRAAVSTPAPVVVKREGTPGAGPAIHPKGKKERPPYPFAPTPPHPYARQPLTRSRPARPRRRHHV